MRYVRYALLLTTLTTAFLLACNDRTPQDEMDCYPPNPDPGAMLGSFDLVCGRPWGYLPETPAGVDDQDGPYHVIYSESVELGAECARCPAVDVNDRIVEHLLEDEDRCRPARVDHIISECVTMSERTTETRCSFEAWYWGSCNIKG